MSDSSRRKRVRVSEESSSSDDDVGPALPPPSTSSSSVAVALTESSPPPGPTTQTQPVVRAPRVSRVPESTIRALVDALPSAALYERSYMHRAPVTHVVVTHGTDFIVTADADGAVKFWKKSSTGVTFVKVYRAHVGGIAALVGSADGARVASVGDDGTVKFFDVASFDLTTLARLGFFPSAAAWAYAPGSPRKILAVADAHLPVVTLLDGDDGAAPPLARARLHAAPVIALSFSISSGLLISADARGMIECWAPDAGSNFAPPKGILDYESKLDTDLFALAQAKVMPTAIAAAPGGRLFAVSSSDGHVRVFAIATGRLVREFAEGADDYASGAAASGSLTAHDLANRVARERAAREATAVHIKALLAPRATDAPPPTALRIPPLNAIFDESGTLLLVPTLLGVKVISLDSNKCVALIGSSDAAASPPPAGLALFQGVPHAGSSQAPGGGGGGGGSGGAVSFSGDAALRPDPTLVAIAAPSRSRFLLYTRREPEGAAELEPGDDAISLLAARDTLNEPPSRADAAAAAVARDAALSRRPGGAAAAPGREVCITTDRGDIVVQLFPEDAPKACENFVALAKRGYYAQAQFFRVIKGFMCQTGDPTNTGTGGVSIWGSEFEDEIVAHRRFTAPGVLAMANAGVKTNGSQFFITTGGE